MTVWDPEQKVYVDFTGETRSFTTASSSTPPQAPTGLQYLSGYESPAVSLVSTEG